MKGNYYYRCDAKIFGDYIGTPNYVDDKGQLDLIPDDNITFNNLTIKMFINS